MSERVLLIEDDPELAALVREYLAGRGFRVEVRSGAQAGLARLREGGVDLLLLDVMLPDGDGFDVCREVRSGSDVPIVMLTARGDEMDRIVGLELGADDYLPKPFNPRELLARMRAVLRRRGAGAGAEGRLRFGRLEIDPEARTVTLDGDARELTGHQFDLLLALARNAGRVLSREALMQQVRGQGVEAFDRSIDVHVSRIRAAIEDDPKHPQRILTIRGVGYVFSRRQDD
ncbi:MAG: response regulator transcription factor [Proteobacteria bacterium]|nr:response regulator transcription factor [Pseudomonadota bacterium]